MKEKHTNLVTNIIPIALLIFCIIFFSELILPAILKIILLSFSALLYFLAVYFRMNGKEKTSKSIIVLNYVLAFSLLTYLLIKKYDLLYYLSNVNIIKNFILSTGFSGVFIYILLHFLQVVFLPIPAAILILAGTLIYGPLLSAIYTIIGIMLGSYVSFYIGRFFGRRIVEWMVGADTVSLYQEKMKKNRDYLLFVAFLFPFFPDDILCMIAGLTDMTFKRFFVISTITRPIGVLLLCYFGGGTVIPYTWGGISILLLLIAAIMVLFFIMMKYQSVLEQLFVKKE